MEFADRGLVSEQNLSIYEIENDDECDLTIQASSFKMMNSVPAGVSSITLIDSTNETSSNTGNSEKDKEELHEFVSLFSDLSSQNVEKEEADQTVTTGSLITQLKHADDLREELRLVKKLKAEFMRKKEMIEANEGVGENEQSVVDGLLRDLRNMSLPTHSIDMNYGEDNGVYADNHGVHNDNERDNNDNKKDLSDTTPFYADTANKVEENEMDDEEEGLTPESIDTYIKTLASQITHLDSLTRGLAMSGGEGDEGLGGEEMREIWDVRKRLCAQLNELLILRDGNEQERETVDMNNTSYAKETDVIERSEIDLKSEMNESRNLKDEMRENSSTKIFATSVSNPVNESEALKCRDLFNSQKDEIYRLAAISISTHDTEPHFLLSVLRGLAKCDSVYKRQRILCMLDEMTRE